MIVEQTVPTLGLLAVIAKKPLEDNYKGIGMGDCFRIHYLEDDSDYDFCKKYCRLFSFEEQDDIRVYVVTNTQAEIVIVCSGHDVKVKAGQVHMHNVHWISAHTCGKQTLCIFPTHAVKEIKWKS